MKATVSSRSLIKCRSVLVKTLIWPISTKTSKNISIVSVPKYRAIKVVWVLPISMAHWFLISKATSNRKVKSIHELTSWLSSCLISRRRTTKTVFCPTSYQTQLKPANLKFQTWSLRSWTRKDKRTLLPKTKRTSRLLWWSLWTCQCLSFS